MKRPLAGKRAFEAMGRSAQSKGYPMDYQRSMRAYWPLWARQAWARGFIAQLPNFQHQKAKP